MYSRRFSRAAAASVAAHHGCHWTWPAPAAEAAPRERSPLSLWCLSRVDAAVPQQAPPCDSGLLIEAVGRSRDAVTFLRKGRGRADAAPKPAGASNESIPTFGSSQSRGGAEPPRLVGHDARVEAAAVATPRRATNDGAKTRASTATVCARRRRLLGADSTPLRGVIRSASAANTTSRACAARAVRRAALAAAVCAPTRRCSASSAETPSRVLGCEWVLAAAAVGA
jgi:hypothetical protein